MERDDFHRSGDRLTKGLEMVLHQAMEGFQKL
jgi:shikimate 5-dehydrogenase